jgi:hypothetical protein
VQGIQGVQGNTGPTGPTGATGPTTYPAAGIALSTGSAWGTSFTNTGNPISTGYGGTGLSSFTANGVVYASSTSALTTGSALTFDGTKLTQTVSTTAAAGVAEFKNSATNAQTANIIASNDAGTALTMRVFGSAAGTYGMVVAGSPIISTTASELNFVADNANGVIRWGLNGAAEAMRLNSTGLGIGTNSPSYRLDVSSASTPVARFTGAANAYVDFTDGSVTSRLQNSGALLFGTTSNHSLLLRTNSTTQATLDTSGNWGLGVTPSAWESARKAIQLSGTASYFAANSVAVIAANNFFDGQNKYIGTGYATQFAQSAGQHIWLTAPSWNGTGSDVISFTQAMTLDASGNLGVTETSPSTFGKFVVKSGTINLVTDTASQRRLSFWSTANGNSENAYIQAQNDGGTTNTGEILFATKNAGGTLAERLRIAATGAIGLSGANYGTAGQVLTSNGSGSAPTWQNAGGSAATPTALGTVYGLTQDASGTANTVLGYQGLNSNTTGSSNVSAGVRALYTNTTGVRLTAIGYNALYSSTTSSENTAVGGLSLLNNTTGAANTAVGSEALRNNTTGVNNAAFGYQTLYTKTTGDNNTAVGTQALYSATTASSNTAVGYYALFGNTTGYYNVSVGRESSRYMTTGAQNAALGDFALWGNTTGNNNVAIGFQARYTAGAANADVAIGYQALYSANPSVSGYSGYNVAIGYQALYSAGTVASNSTGVCTAVGYLAGYNTNAAGNSAQDTFIGSQSGYNNTSGYGNTFVGALSGYGQTTGDQNTCIGGLTGRYSTGSGGNKLVAVGYTAGYSNTGNDNTFVGTGAGSANTSAIDNAFFGTYSGISNTTGSQNAAFGKDSLRSNTTASYNTTIGYFSGYSLTTGDRNTFLGASAGSGGYGASAFTTGQYNISIGFTTGASSGNRNNSIVIGTPYSVVDKGENTGFIQPNGGGVYQGNNSSSWSTTSDFRLKKNIVDNNEGLEKIAAIRVRNFEYRLPEEVTELPEHTAIKRPGVQLGVIAQELQQVCPDCVKEESTGVLSVDSDNVFWHMVNAIKQLNAKVEALQAEITTLKGA